MEATAPGDPTELVGSSPRARHLEVVPTSASPDAEPSVGRSASIGAVVGFLASACAVAVGCALNGLDIGSSIGLGVFVGMWSGVGFGFMVGGTIPLARHADAVAAANHGKRA